MYGRLACCTHAYTVYTPVGDEGCMEGEPAVHMLTQCTLLLVMRDVWKVSLLYTCLHSVHPCGDEGCMEGEPAVHMLTQCTPLLAMRDVQKASLLYTCLHSVHPCW